MNIKTEELIKKAVARWDDLMKIQLGAKKEDSWSSLITVPVVGTLDWNNPKLLFVFAVSQDGGYEGSATQIGITKDGRLMYEYQSHCSCNSFEDTSNEGSPIPQDTTKTYELTMLPLDWEYKIQDNIEKMLNT
jgi:hypothetical protein